MTRLLFTLTTLLMMLMLSCRSSGGSPTTTSMAAISGATPLSAGGSVETSPPLVTGAGVATLQGVTPIPSPSPTSIPAPTKMGSAEVPLVSARAVVIVDERSGAVLYEKNAQERLAPASLTKIATALVALDHDRLQDIVRVDYDATGLEDSTLMGVNPGDQVTLEDLLYGLMLPSGNEAALAIANYIAGSEERFVEKMNAKVRELGLHNTHFVNPHGLDAPGHYSSAYDMVMLARYGMLKWPEFRQLAAARKWAIRGRAPDGSPKIWEVYNLNRFLAQYEGADGVKIGYTDAAGRTIVASVTRNGHRVYVGLMGSSDLWGDCRALFDYVFTNYSWP